MFCHNTIFQNYYIIGTAYSTHTMRNNKYSFIFYDTVGIGRGRDGSRYECYLPVPTDVRVSKNHCMIIHRGDKLYLKDEGSRNGTFLNGKRVDRPIVIQKDDVIGVGETRLEILKILRESE